MSNIYYEAPNKIDQEHINQNRQDWLFLAGSITGAWDWQKVAAEKMLPYYNILNPRRNDYHWDIKEERIQIEWEQRALTLSGNILFYFSHETLAPITLFEYGVYLMNQQKNIFVAVHPEYKRRNDIIIQTELYRPGIVIHDSLEKMLKFIIDKRQNID